MDLVGCRCLLGLRLACLERRGFAAKDCMSERDERVTRPESRRRRAARLTGFGKVRRRDHSLCALLAHAEFFVGLAVPGESVTLVEASLAGQGARPAEPAFIDFRR